MNAIEISEIKCRDCDGIMVIGQAIPTAFQFDSDGNGNQGAWAGHSPLVPVLKCQKCGHSFTANPATQTMTTDEPKTPGQCAREAYNRYIYTLLDGDELQTSMPDFDGLTERVKLAWLNAITTMLPTEQP